MKRHAHGGRQRSRWNGPLEGCPVQERHSSAKCKHCHAALMRAQRKTGKWGWQPTPAKREKARLRMAAKRASQREMQTEAADEVRDVTETKTDNAR